MDYNRLRPPGRNGTDRLSRMEDPYVQDNPTAHPIVEHLQKICHQISHGNYREADDLFSMTSAHDDVSPLIADLAESFGLMLVRIEAREIQLERLVAELTEAKKELEIANRQLKKDNRRLNEVVEQMKVEIDRHQTQQQVGEITETDYFRQLSSRAREIRARQRRVQEAGQ